MQITSADPCHNRLFSQNIKHRDDNFSEHIGHREPHALFDINIYIGAKCTSSVPEIVGIGIPAPNIRNFSTFSCPYIASYFVAS
jgi:hypothetical protein